MAVSVTSQKWILASSIDVENPSQQYRTGGMTVSMNTWYNLTLSVIGKTVDAWVDSQQVLSQYNIPSVTSGWAAIGSSVQSSKIYTYAQYDNFSVRGNQLQCQAPSEGNPLTIMWCGGT